MKGSKTKGVNSAGWDIGDNCAGRAYWRFLKFVTTNIRERSGTRYVRLDEQDGFLGDERKI